MKKTKNVYRKSYGFVLGFEDVEHPDPNSEAIPGQSLTIEEILKRHLRGQLITGVSSKPPQFNGQEDFSDIDITKNPDFDLTDLENEVSLIEEKVRAQKERIALAKKAKEDEAKRKDDEAKAKEGK